MGLFLPGDERSKVGFDRELAEIFGINTAIILSRIIWSIEKKIETNDTEFFINGRWWMYDSVTNFCNYSSLGRFAVKRSISHLKNLKIIETSQFRMELGECENWYSVHGNNLADLMKSPPIGAKPTSGGDRSKTNQCPTSAKPTSGEEQNQPVGGAKPTSGDGAKPTNLSNSLFTKSPKSHSNSPPLSNVTPIQTRKRPKKEKPPLPPDLLELGKNWHDFARAVVKTKPYASWCDEYFAEALGKVIRSTGLTIQRMGEVLNFLKTDEWWKPNAISPASLLNISKTNGKRKIDNILDAMERQAQPTKGKTYERPKARDLSADNGKFANVNDDKPW